MIECMKCKHSMIATDDAYGYTVRWVEGCKLTEAGKPCPYRGDEDGSTDKEGWVMADILIRNLKMPTVISANGKGMGVSTNELHFVDSDHVWINGCQFISLKMVGEMLRERSNRDQLPIRTPED